MNDDLTVVLATMTCPVAFGRALKALLRRHNLSLRKVAQMAGLSRDFVWRATQGRDVGAAGRAKLVEALGAL